MRMDFIFVVSTFFGGEPERAFFLSALIVGFVGIIGWAKITMICQEAQLEVMLGKMGVKHGTCPRS